MRQAMEDGVSEVLSNVVEDVGQAMDRNISGAHILHELLSAPWLRAVLKMYECLLQFQRLTPSPFLPYASGLSHEIMSGIQKVHRPSAEARELYSLLSSPHIQALLSSHDSVAQSDYGPVLPPLPDEMPEDEEAMRIVCLVKNNQPLNREVQRRGSIGDGIGMIRSRWSSLRRFTLDRLVPVRRAWSGEELRATESEARPLPLPRAGPSRPFLPRYQSTGSCCLCPQTAELQKKRLNQSAPSVFVPAPCSGTFLEKPKHIREEHASTGGSSDDYAYPPPPVPAYSLSLPNSPVLYKRGPAGGESRNIPTPGRTPSGTRTNPLRAHTAPCSPATLRSSQQQGVNTLPTVVGHHGCQSRSNKKRQEEPPSMVPNYTDNRHNGSQNQPKQRQNKQLKPKPLQHSQPPDLTKQCGLEELRSTVHTSSIRLDPLHLDQKMVVATERIAESAEENTQALNLLAEVVDKLQGLIVASKNQEVSPSRRLKKSTPPTPPPRVSSISPKVVRKPPTPYPHRLSTSSSSSCSSSSSSSSVSEDFLTSQNPKRMNGGSKRTMVMFGPTHRASGSGSHGQVRLNNGTVSKALMENKQDCNSTGCLTARKKKKKKKNK